MIASAVVTGFACLGALAVLLFSFGAVRFPARSDRAETSRAIIDTSPDGLVVTDREARILYANDAYRALSKTLGANDIKPVERLFTGAPDVSEAIYRLAQAARNRARGRARICGSRPPLNGRRRKSAWYRIRVRPLDASRRTARRSGPYPT